jgi:hypothetical protein
MGQHQPIHQNKKPNKTKKPQGPGFGIGVDSNTAGGGVWAQTSAKREKLGELKIELKFDLGQRTLDDVATQEELYDLYLVDGVTTVVKLMDCGGVLEESNLDLNQKKSIIFHDIQDMMKRFENETSTNEISKHQFEQHFTELIAHVKKQKENHPAAPKDYNLYDSTATATETEIATGTAIPASVATTVNDTNEKSSTKKESTSALLHLRDFILFDPPDPNEKIPIHLQEKTRQPISEPFSLCYEYLQLTLLQSSLESLSTQWDTLTTISNGDQDRAATRGEILPPVQNLNVQKLHSVLNAFTSGKCSDRVEALWNLVDKDDDGLLNQDEMETVVNMSIKPMEDAVRMFITDGMEVWPMRKWGLPPPCHDEMNNNGKEKDPNVLANQSKQQWFWKRWAEGRKEKRSKGNLLTMANNTIKRHFEVEAETPHRLRCIYAWAEKSHQDGKTENVLLDTGGSNDGFFSGARKRYVELEPKISYAEFREVQKEHFSQLDGVGQELCTSLKEDLWVHQGKGRQDRELKRQLIGFTTVVSLIDYAITIN